MVPIFDHLSADMCPSCFVYTFVSVSVWTMVARINGSFCLCTLYILLSRSSVSAGGMVSGTLSLVSQKAE
jgi:hypothetical protein